MEKGQRSRTKNTKKKAEAAMKRIVTEANRSIDKAGRREGDNIEEKHTL
jgi:hypothetical protein